jgi:hypothetical protein
MMDMSYCDYIAHTIVKPALNAEASTQTGVVVFAGPVKMDLDKKEGYMLSTQKTIDCVDVNGRKYRITIEEL